MVPVDHEKVVKVASDFFGRDHRRAKFELCPIRIFLGQRADLNARRQGQLGAYPLLLKRERLPLPHSLHIVRRHRQNIDRPDSCHPPEGVRHKARLVQIDRHNRTHNAEPQRTQPGRQHLHMKECCHRSRTQHKKRGDLRPLGYLFFDRLLQKTLDHVGLNLHPEHLPALIDRSKIGVLKRSRIRPDQHNAARPVVGRHFAADHPRDRHAVIIIARPARVRNVEESVGGGRSGNCGVGAGRTFCASWAFCAGRGGACRAFCASLVSACGGSACRLLLQIHLCRYITHRIDAGILSLCRGARLRRIARLREFSWLHIQQSVTHHSVHIAHRIDMPLRRACPKLLIGLQKPHNRRSIDHRRMSVHPGDSLSELRH